mgnify:CR=1 FL=1
MRIRGVLLAAILAAACGGGSDEGEVHAAAPDSAGAAAGLPDTTNASAAAPAAEPVPAGVVLAPDGLVVGGARLAFGGGRDQVLATVGGVLGAPREQGTNEECPAGPLAYVQYAGLQLVFQDGSFVGWFAQEGSPLRTAKYGLSALSASESSACAGDQNSISTAEKAASAMHHSTRPVRVSG